MKILRIIIASFQALLSLSAFVFISAVAYAKFALPYNIIIAIITLIIGLFASRLIFNMMRRRGVIAVMANNRATHELDQLNPLPASDTLQLSPAKLAHLFSTNKASLTNSVTVSIWGDWEGRKLNVRHHIESINFKSGDNMLIISFSDNCFLEVKNPKLIFLTESYLKIVKATKILWRIPNKDDYHWYSYHHISETIKTDSNTDWKAHKYDVGIGMNAIYLQG